MSAGSYPASNVTWLWRPYVGLAFKQGAKILAEGPKTMVEEKRYIALKDLDDEVQGSSEFANADCDVCILTLADALGLPRQTVRDSVELDRKLIAQGKDPQGPQWIRATAGAVPGITTGIGPTPYVDFVSSSSADKFAQSAVSTSLGPVAAFYVPSIEAAKATMAAWKKSTGERKADKTFAASVASGAWKALSLDATRAQLLADVLGTTGKKVQEVWQAQQGLLAQGKQVSVPSAALTKAAKVPAGAPKPKPPVTPVIADTSSGKSNMVLVALGAVALGAFALFGATRGGAGRGGPALARNPRRRACC